MLHHARVHLTQSMHKRTRFHTLLATAPVTSELVVLVACLETPVSSGMLTPVATLATARDVDAFVP